MNLWRSACRIYYMLYARSYYDCVYTKSIDTRCDSSLLNYSEMCLAKNEYTYTSIALFQLITYPDRTNVSMCSMWIFPRSVPTYNHLLWSGRWMQVILLKTNYTISHSLKIKSWNTVRVLVKNLSIILHSIRVSSHAWFHIYSMHYEYREKNSLMARRNSKRKMPHAR